MVTAIIVEMTVVVCLCDEDAGNLKFCEDIGCEKKKGTATQSNDDDDGVAEGLVVNQ